MWSKLDDGFPDHPKVVKAGPLASWLYVCGLCYSNRYLTDGFIPTEQIRKLADVDNPTGLAEKLVEVGLWERAVGGYQVHDFHHLNLTAEEAKERREEISRARAEAGRMGAIARWQNSKPDGNLLGKDDGKQHGKNMAPNQNQNQNLKPVPKPKPKKGANAHSYPSDFEVTDEMYNHAHKEHPDLDIEGATKTWQNSMKANTEKYQYTDWRAAWYGAMDRAAGWGSKDKQVGGYANGSGPTNNRSAIVERAIRARVEATTRANEEPDNPFRLDPGADPI